MPPKYRHSQTWLRNNTIYVYLNLLQPPWWANGWRQWLNVGESSHSPQRSHIQEVSSTSLGPPVPLQKHEGNIFATPWSLTCWPYSNKHQLTRNAGPATLSTSVRVTTWLSPAALPAAEKPSGISPKSNTQVYLKRLFMSPAWRLNASV